MTDKHPQKQGINSDFEADAGPVIAYDKFTGRDPDKTDIDTVYL